MISVKALNLQLDLIYKLKARATSAPKLSSKFIKSNFASLETAFLIRAVEMALLDLFAQGKMNGTVHTCVGQELTGVAISNALKEGDWVTSNHRCHGHFIAKTGRWADLIDELLGLKSGVCGGIGSSQHLFDHGFISNGTQGSLLPVASGLCYGYVRDGKFSGLDGEFALKLNRLATQMGGSFAAEHGIGRAKTVMADNLRGSVERELMASLKKAVDEDITLNPGALFSIDR